MPRIIPEPRYFSMPSSDVGSEVFKNLALYCWPWVRSLTHSPDAVTHSPAEITAACPTTVTSSRWPHALIRKTQKPPRQMDQSHWSVKASVHESGGGTKHKMKLICGAKQTTACPVGLSLRLTTRSHGTATHSPLMIV